MSENPKHHRSGATPMKNPLLSASVTGLTFDDFPNKPLLLPAAPPIVPVSNLTPVVTPSSLISREQKSLVIVGSSSLDTENLDEINLNATNEENQTTDISDTNANPLLDPSGQVEGTNDSILSQAASSFSALPSVASNVFSTFSKRITAISSRETTPINDQYLQDSNANFTVPQIDIQPTYIQQQHTKTGISSQASPPFYAPPLQGGNYFASSTECSSRQADITDNLSAPEPPKFYTPSDVPSIPASTAVPPPPNVGGQNNFRFSSKKKLYAPIPGLSEQAQQPTAVVGPSAAISGSISYDISYNSGSSGHTSTDFIQQSQPAPYYSTPNEQKLEDRKVASGLFSKITNLAPTGVLQNITGLVQSATDSLTQTVKADSVQEYNSPQTSQTVLEQQNYFFEAAPPPATNFFVPPSQNKSLTSTPATNLFLPQQQADTLPPASVFFQNASAATTFQADIPLFDASNFSDQSTVSTTLQTSLVNKAPSKPPSQSNSSYVQTITNEQVNLTDQKPNNVPQVGLFDPTKFLTLHHSSTNNQIGSSVPSLPPVSGGNVVPPKSTIPTSYRLQKGTKLYKNPLTPQETAPIHVTPSQIQSIKQTGQPPYTYPAPSQSASLFAPPTVTGGQKVEEEGQSVSLVTPHPTNGLKSYDSEHKISLFVPAAIQEQKSNDQDQRAPLKPNNQGQTIPLFDPFKVQQNSNNLQQSLAQFLPPPPILRENTNNKQHQVASLFAPSVNEHKSNQNTPFFTPISLEEQKSVDNKQSITVEERKSNESSEGVPLFAASVIEEQKTITNAQLSSSSETRENVELVDEKLQLQQLQGNELEQIFRNPLIATVNKIPEKNICSNSRLVAEPTDPVVEKEDKETPKQTASEDFLEQTLQKFSLTSNAEETKPLTTLPPVNTQAHISGNPYRRGSTTETTKPAAIQPTLANFFTPEPLSSSSDLNFFATLPAQETQLPDLKSGSNFFSETTDNKQLNTLPGIQTVNFFANSCNEFAEIQPPQPTTDLEPPITAFFPKPSNNLGIVPTILENSENNQFIEQKIQQSAVPLPSIGFENFMQFAPTAPDSTNNIQDSETIQQETTIQTQQPEVVNRFSNYFNQSQNQLEIVKDPSTFFDSFARQTQQQQQQQLQPQSQQQQQQGAEESIPSSVVTNEEQRIQYFFNNPPPKDANAVGDLNYDLVHSGLGIKNLQQRSLTPISNLVEPPSSACSEFSEISNSTAGQKSIAANLSITESSEKSPEKQEIKTENVTEIVKQQPASAVIANKTNTEELDEDFLKYYADLPKEVLEIITMASDMSSDDKPTTSMAAGVLYKPVVKHWFFKRTVGDKHIWIPFSHYDSALLETSLLMNDSENSNIVAVEGGRYDVNIRERKKISVYWESEPIEVRRCSWFFKAVDSKYVPYEEQTAELLEQEYKQAAESGVWHKSITLGMGEQVVFHGPTVIVHFQQQNNDAWGGTTQTTMRPRVVKRDLDDFKIEQGESQKVDHLLFMVHGIGSACDLKLRSVEEVVEDFRTIARQLVQSHYKNSSDLGLVGRVEVLPISWHSHLHSVEMGIDEKLRMITLESIPKLRNFTNDTLLDILFYTSPTFCQKIMNAIVTSLNSLYLKYRERHPDFNGGVSLAGHSLGSLILFDLLCHQNPIKESEEKNLENLDQFLTVDGSSAQMDSNQLSDKQMSYTMGPAGTGQPFINYGQLIFQPKKFFALGSPIGMFVTIRGIDKLGLDFRLPTCPGFYNIFHPYDPVAYRIEALVNPDLSGIRPVLIPHHKGRKRMHLELKETMARVSTDLKHRFLDKFKTTLESINIFGSATKSTRESEEFMEKEVDKVIQMQIQLEQENQNHQSSENLASDKDSQNGNTGTKRQRTDSVSTSMSDDVVEIDFPLGKLNDSKRIDYVLQEAPLEFINEYIFALSSHVCYWDSEDTILFVMKEIYSGLGISPDSQVPQQTMTIERPSSLLFLFL